MKSRLFLAGMGEERTEAFEFGGGNAEVGKKDRAMRTQDKGQKVRS